MGTSNFHVKNASKVFALFPSEEDDSEYWWGDQIEDIQSVLEEHGYALNTGSIRDADELRSYPSQLLGVKSIDREFMDVWAEVHIVSTIRSGYYEGASLDWSVSIFMCNDEYDMGTFEDCYDEHLAWLSDHSSGLCKANAPKLLAWVNQAKDELVEELEKLYEQLSTPLRVAARFSNGETIYTEA